MKTTEQTASAQAKKKTKWNWRPWEATDAPAAVALWSLGLLIFALFVWVSVDDRFHDPAGWREAVLKGGGAVLLLGGSYYGARTLTQARAEQRANRLLKAIEFMGHDKPAVQKAGRALIVSMVDEPTKSPGDEVQAMIEKVAAATRVT